MDTPTPEEARRATLEFLNANDLPSNPHLPKIEARSDLKPPTSEQVALRAYVLVDVIGVGYGVPGKKLIAHLKENDLWDSTSANERALLQNETPAQQEIVDAAWLAECVQVFAWGLGMTDLDPFIACDDNLADHFLGPQAKSPREFARNARLRPFRSIYLQCDLLYCLHWAVRDARLKGSLINLDGSTIGERHRAINWLAGVEENWDEVSTDT